MDDEYWVNPNRVADDFTQGVREDGKELFKYMKLAKGEERNAYITFNKLIIDGAAFMFNRVKCELEAIKNVTSRQQFTTMNYLLQIVIAVTVEIDMLTHVTHQVTDLQVRRLHVVLIMRTVHIRWTLRAREEVT